MALLPLLTALKLGLSSSVAIIKECFSERENMENLELARFWLETSWL
jgi:hypothetical protein